MDVIGNDSVDEVQAQADELQFNAMLVQSFNEGALGKSWQTYLVQIEDGADQRQDDQVDAHPAYAEACPAFGPEAGLFAHIKKSSLKWPSSSRSVRRDSEIVPDIFVRGRGEYKNPAFAIECHGGEGDVFCNLAAEIHGKGLAIFERNGD